MSEVFFISDLHFGHKKIADFVWQMPTSRMSQTKIQRE